MRVTIQGNPKEIAALVAALQERRAEKIKVDPEMFAKCEDPKDLISRVAHEAIHPEGAQGADE